MNYSEIMQNATFYVAEFDRDEDCYLKISNNMSLINARKFLNSNIKDNPLGDYKVLAILDI